MLSKERIQVPNLEDLQPAPSRLLPAPGAVRWGQAGRECLGAVLGGWSQKPGSPGLRKSIVQVFFLAPQEAEPLRSSQHPPAFLEHSVEPARKMPAHMPLKLQILSPCAGRVTSPGANAFSDNNNRSIACGRGTAFSVLGNLYTPYLI